jgi:hypothetical protein
MSARNAVPTPAEPKLATTRRHQRKSEYNSITAMNYRTTEKDVAKLIDCLAKWTQDLRAARSATPEVPPCRSRSPSRPPRVISSTPFYPRGNPLTESMEFTDRDGAVWLAYIEGSRRAPSRQRWSATPLPDRHLRFDCASESRFTSVLPAGSPFLTEGRLQSLLDEAQPDLPWALTTVLPPRGNRVIEWSTGAVKRGREAIADWYRRWRQGASQTEALRGKVLELLSGAANRIHGIVDVLLGHRPARL